jgi:formylglycine-generating enzyme required for sulfatase activity
MDRLIDAIKAEAKISRGHLIEPRTPVQGKDENTKTALAHTIRSRMVRVTKGPSLYGVDLLVRWPELVQCSSRNTCYAGARNSFCGFRLAQDVDP